MINLDKIMVSFDLSEYSIKAFKYGCDLAEETKADLIIANVINQRDVNAVMDQTGKRTCFDRKVY